MPNIAVVWDFDGTLTPDDSTSIVVDSLEGENREQFWSHIKALRGDQDRPEWEHILASDAPIWTYALSRVASAKGVALNSSYFRDVSPSIKLYDNVVSFLKNIKSLETDEEFQLSQTSIFHFVVSAGLHDLVRLVFPSDVVEHVWGCRYEIIEDANSEDGVPESVPVYCMDETAKTRALFEISKGTFRQPTEKAVNKKVPDTELFCKFSDMIYIGDGFTDVPALSLVRSRGGLGVVVTDPTYDKHKKKQKTDQLRRDCRADLITMADFSDTSELYKAVKARCIQLQQKHRACTLF